MDVGGALGPELRADCANCFALCCVALRFAKSAEFAFDKPAGTPCRHLAGDHRCTIHADLRKRGFAGCVAYDCQGAGQKVSQVVFGGTDWRDDADTARWALVVFPVVRQLHEILAFGAQALALPAAEPARERLEAALREIDAATRQPPEQVVRADVAGWRAVVAPLLDEVSARARAPVPSRSYRNADLVGADLRGRDLRRADLAGAYLVAADLRGADLRGADLRGADLRDAKLAGADLSGSLFLTHSQVQAARGDATTRLPAGLAVPRD